jgi:hypothetical protein
MATAPDSTNASKSEVGTVLDIPDLSYAFESLESYKESRADWIDRIAWLIRAM